MQIDILDQQNVKVPLGRATSTEVLQNAKAVRIYF